MNQENPRKVLISFLGTGNYVPVTYSWPEDNEAGIPKHNQKCMNYPTKFVQEAIATNLCESWTEKDCIMVFRTEQSNAKNWLDTKIEKPDGSGEETVQGLASTLKNIKFTNGEKLKCRINPEPEDKENIDSYIIPTGLDNNTETEMEIIFNQVFSKLEYNDVIYFDVTHAFRTIPLFATVLFNYAQVLKKSSLKGIYYGAYEKLNRDTKVAPIANLIDITRLQQITSAAANFRDFGNMESFSKLLLGNKKLDNNIRKISNVLKQLDWYIQTCQLKEIEKGKYLKDIESCIKDLDKEKTTEAQRTLLKTISIELRNIGFTPISSYTNIEAAIDWSIKYNLIQQALTMAQEYIVTVAYDRLVESGLLYKFKEHIGSELKKDVDEIGNFEIRNKLGYIISSYDPNSKIKPQCFRGLTDKYTDLFKSSMGANYRKIRNLRNSINHANTSNRYQKKISDDEKDIETFKGIWSSCKTILESYENLDQPH